MTDVRLTATNPEDSSVVPVACNSKGELLITEPKIEEIDNDVTIKGKLTLDLPGDSEATASSWTTSDMGQLTFKRDVDDKVAHALDPSGQSTHRRMGIEQKGTTTLSSSTYGFAVLDPSGSAKWSVNWNGTATGRKILLRTEANDPDKWNSSSSSSLEDATGADYGRFIDVGVELAFLRAQVRALMEKLKMTPEGGWPVWDGSDESS